MKHNIKKITLSIISTLVLLTGFAKADAKKMLLDHLDLRIKANIEYDIQYAKEAAETTIAERIVPIEKKHGYAWVEFLHFLKKKEDFETIARLLRLEILGELTGSIYELEYAENKLEKIKLETEINKYTRQLTEVENAMKTLGIKITPREEAK